MATLPAEIRKISKKYMTNPFEVQIGTANTSNENFEHQYFVVPSREKYAALKRIVDFTPDIYGIIFCRTKAETQQIAETLIKDGYNADSLHGDLQQAQRDKVMRAFKSRTLQLLVATDVAARGIDVNDVSHIINLHLPDDMDFYTHRSGRTARAGKTGISMVLIDDRDISKIRQLEKKIQTKFERNKVPTGLQVCEQQLARRVPAWQALRVASAWAGHYDVNTFDHNLILGLHPQVDNLYFANGLSGHGLQQSPAIGRALAELIVAGRFETLDLSEFGWERVLAQRPLREINVV